MKLKEGNVVYIDGANLHRGSKELGVVIDYKKFRGWLWQKFNIEKAYIFLGLIEENVGLYSYLQECGFILIFKPTITNSVKKKRPLMQTYLHKGPLHIVPALYQT